MSTQHYRAIVVVTQSYGNAQFLWNEIRNIESLEGSYTGLRLRVSSICGPMVNDTCTFTIYPDGSNYCTPRNRAYAKLMVRAKEILRKSTAYWVQVSLGEMHQRVVESHAGKVNWPLSAQNAVNTLKHQLRSVEGQRDEAHRLYQHYKDEAARNLHRAQDPRDLEKIQKLHEKLAEVETWRKQDVHNIGKLRAVVADLLGAVRGVFSVARVLDGPEKADKTYLTFQGESLLKLEKALTDVLFETR